MQHDVVDGDTPTRRVLYQFLHVVMIVREQVKSQGLFLALHDFDGFLQSVHSNHWHDRAEDLKFEMCLECEEKIEEVPIKLLVYCD